MDRRAETAGAMAALLAAGGLAVAWRLVGEWGAVLLLAAPFVLPAAFRSAAGGAWRRAAWRELERLPRLTLRRQD